MDSLEDTVLERLGSQIQSVHGLDYFPVLGHGIIDSEPTETAMFEGSLVADTTAIDIVHIRCSMSFNRHGTMYRKCRPPVLMDTRHSGKPPTTESTLPTTYSTTSLRLPVVGELDHLGFLVHDIDQGLVEV